MFFNGKPIQKQSGMFFDQKYLTHRFVFGIVFYVGRLWPANSERRVWNSTLFQKNTKEKTTLRIMVHTNANNLLWLVFLGIRRLFVPSCIVSIGIIWQRKKTNWNKLKTAKQFFFWLKNTSRTDACIRITCFTKEKTTTRQSCRNFCFLRQTYFHVIYNAHLL